MTDQNAATAAGQWLGELERALGAGNTEAAAALFGEESYWRDLSALTWNLHTSEGREQIKDMLDGVGPDAWPRDLALASATEGDGVIEAWYTFTNKSIDGKGLLRLRDGKCWTLLSTAQGLREFPEPAGALRERGADHGAEMSSENWLDRRNRREAEFGITDQPYVLVIGGGQGGIGLGARLKRLGVPALVIDKHPRPGDQWRSRYHSLALHDPVWYDHMPYIPFPDHWPVFTPKDKMGDWLEHYTRLMELDYWSNTEATSATHDPGTGTWTVQLIREGKAHTLHPAHVVIATGMSGIPNVPSFAGRDVFAGEQNHSSTHPGGEAYRGKNVVVIGANNSAHDICADLAQNGAKPVMVQRSSTHIVRSESLMDTVLGPLYSEEALANGIGTETADLIFASIPYKVLPEFHRPAFEKIRADDADFYQGLADAGFDLDFGDDDSGLFLKYLRRGSGYYIDIGASALVADGSIALAHGDVARLTEDSVVLDDGTVLPADAVIYATGYGSMNGWAAKLISQDVADAVGKCWGLGSETTKDPGPWQGELRNMWKPTRQENLWFHGGNLHQSRHYSKYLALQLKARFEGIDTPVYALAETHHTS
ncbi:NAD(P)/FAD-dependent oxidoreductase [Paeniglutamicibacter psychrophenolicus]|uniref:Flavoprotein involved in K+ transport n=1 Tax=Paeniglutamicibacter psychrophenolicus TaxID=257454 RepID=A0ABS4W898_9MICC|nr:NAD(P)/FAD-dependent oxidoreductase [Paeniglutamicibacter psychrophenolicus]MBP2372236.1 putative flavoprotein involved in K+ transport [Paeniglutamicibacter psychrophenolicus]